MKRRILRDWLIPLVILLGLTIPFWYTDLDLAMGSLFFDPSEGWIYKDMHPWRFLYDFGTMPAWIIGYAALGALIGSLWIARMAPYRRIALFFLLVMLVGPGLVVNAIFKDHWGRPRPRSVEAFGGPERFLRVWERSESGKGKSFPSGHAAAGFSLLSPFFVARRISKRWAAVFLTLGLSTGSLVGLARIIQGGHFLSDVIWAGGFIYLCGLGLYYLLRLDRGAQQTHSPGKRS